MSRCNDGSLDAMVERAVGVLMMAMMLGMVCVEKCSGTGERRDLPFVLYKCDTRVLPVALSFAIK